MKRVLQFAIAAMMLFAACSKEDETPPPLTQEQEGAAVVEGEIPNDPLPPATIHANASKYKVSEAEAIRNLNAFLSTMNGDGLSKSGNQVRIAGISAFRTKGSNSISKSLNTEEEYATVDVDTLMYAVNFADSMGFALMSADKRTAPIFAITEQGNLDFDNLEDEENEGLLIFLDGAIDKAIVDIATYTDAEDTDNAVSLSKKNVLLDTWDIKYQPSLLLQTRWGQSYPYNFYCDGYPAGCLITAIVQIASYYKAIDHVVCTDKKTEIKTSANLDWTQIFFECKNNMGKLSTRNSKLSVACLYKAVGEICDAEYATEGTSGNESKAIKWLKECGLNATKIADYNLSKIIAALNAKAIVYVRGYGNKLTHLFRPTEYKEGHSWVIDGFVGAVNGSTTYNLVHCNWGWDGRANGYYLSDAFDVHAGPEIQDSYGFSHISDDYKIRYKIQYSIISK